MCFLYFILISYLPVVFFFFFNDTATTEIYTLSLHDALPICLGLSFDALVLHPQLNDVANLAGAFPDTKIVLNHVGRLVGIGAYAGKLSEQFPRWAASIKALAAHENVYVKVGGLADSDQPADVVEYD